MGVNPVVNTDIFNSMFRKQMKMDFYTATLAGQITVAKEFPPVLLLDPDGSARDVLLPAEADSKGLAFWIFNTAGGAPEILTVKEDSDTTAIVVMDQNEFGFVYCDGTDWRGYTSSMADITASAAELNILDGATLTTAELNILTGVVATAAELNRVADVSSRLVSGGATLTVTEALHDGKTILWDQGTGSVITLPAATGSGMKLRFVVSVLVASGAASIACVGTDEFNGHCLATDTDTSDTVVSYPAVVGDDFDVFSLDGSTKGGLVGDVCEIEDIASGIWAIKAQVSHTGNTATPFAST